MKRIYIFAILLSTCMMASAQVNEILGRWKTVDDKTGNSYSVVLIYRGSDGLYYGKIDRLLMGPRDAVCTECKGADKNKKLEGLVFIRGMHEEKGELRGGKLLDPESGKFYYGKIYLKNGKLVLRGSLDRAGLLGRSQTWLRAK
ncbi:MAG: DUF2147 domain-containing protein [Paludibacteraceae bacterium]|nr:DUF2147 domain-containing protein [Paludibacteraceae bacterium]